MSTGIEKILQQMSMGVNLSEENPFNNSEFKSDKRVKFEEEAAKIHSNIKNLIHQDDDELELLANELRQAAGFGDVAKCSELINHPKFSNFCELKDESGFNAMNYSVTYGHTRISDMLLDADVEPDVSNLNKFINVGGDVIIGDLNHPNIDLNKDELEELVDFYEPWDPNKLKQFIGGDSVPMRKITYNEEDNSMISLDISEKDILDNEKRTEKEAKIDKSDYNKFIEDLNNRSELDYDHNEFTEIVNVQNSSEKLTSNDPENLLLCNKIKKVKDFTSYGDSMYKRELYESREKPFNLPIPIEIANEIGESGLDIPKRWKQIVIPFESKFSGDMIDSRYSQKSTIQPKQKVDSFASALKAKFSKSNFSSGRSNDKPLKVAPRTEVTPEQLEEMMLKMDQNSYSIRNIEFVDKYASRDVTKLLCQESSIDPQLLAMRRIILPSDPEKDHLRITIKNTLSAQIGFVKSKRLTSIVDEVYNVLIFYRDIYLRLLPINNVEIKESQIHGSGIFATRNIKVGEIITFYFPYFLEHVINENDKEGIILVPIISRKVFNKENDGKLTEMRRGSIRIIQDFYLVGDDSCSIDSRFLGHFANDPCDFSVGNIDYVMYEQEISQKANASVVSYVNDRRFIYIAATRNIKEGEEILVPYGHKYWEISK